jgi:hypothetical protein
VVSATDPHGRSLKFLDRTPFQTHYFSENLVAQGIDPETSRPYRFENFVVELLKHVVLESETYSELCKKLQCCQLLESCVVWVAQRTCKRHETTTRLDYLTNILREIKAIDAYAKNGKPSTKLM